MNFFDQYDQNLTLLCKKHLVDKLYVFGSVNTQNFSENSDIDLVVKFKNVELSSYFDNYISFKEKLQTFFDRKVDLLEEQAIRNPFIKRAIERSKKVLYG